ncbi:MAG: hypothetical protein Q4F84_05720, partial [Fibrobacter sp.]|nr:hypothetical protein [Fibrobacter sp.]
MNPLDTLGAQSQMGLFSVEPGLMIWTWIVFLLLFIILKKFAWGPMMKSVYSRETLLSEAVENAKKTKEELESIAQRQKQMIGEAEETVKSIIESGKKKAEIVAQEVLKKAQQEADLSIVKAREQIEG